MIVIQRLIRDRVLQITALLVVISLFIGRPKQSDISFATLWSILAMMTVIQIFEHLHILDYWAYRLTSRANNTRQLTWWFIFWRFLPVCFFSNDVTVLNFGAVISAGSQEIPTAGNPSSNLDRDGRQFW